MSSPVSLSVQLPDDLVEQIARRVAELLRNHRENEVDEQSPWLTFEQACAYTGLSRDALYKLTAARAIAMRKRRDGQGLRFHRDELDAWMDTYFPRVDRLA